jgi:hypothetical protein
MATCLIACFGQIVAQQHGIQVFSRIGGKYLGIVKVPNKLLSAFKKVRFLQEQVARLCPHPTRRPHAHLLLYVGQKRIGPPDLPILDDLNEDASLQVQHRLEGCTRLEMLWDEQRLYLNMTLDWVEMMENLAGYYRGCADKRYV